MIFKEIDLCEKILFHYNLVAIGDASWENAKKVIASCNMW